MLSGLDIIVIMFILGGILGGVGRGFLGTIIDISGIAFGLIVGSFIYTAPVFLFAKFEITGTAVDLIFYALSSIILALVVIILLETLRKKVEIKPFVDRIFGGVFGSINGFVAAASILVIMTTSIQSGQEIDQTKIASVVRNGILKFYEKIERHNITLPKMIILPVAYKDEFGRNVRAAKFIKLNFTKFEGFTCMNCEGKVRFEGYFPKYGVGIVPKFVCEKCGRTSDGCQTYEGYHKLYNACPIELARSGLKFDCGNWPNHTWITPTGPCPLDNNSLDLMLWREPIRY
ncbi:MAG: Colicin V production protein [candidate division TA06 bacterium ADurb.Bin131]|uniref:Colicin V production protein n=1 Tax=candidate division TA06 bacterium ADurb.Bin131 TaxID=1852827 RepID=A0A1V6C8M9_UNCT6|nr:MAG: Colicin V production protein [candidate division TA06 bacterium ADurb.Bin131]HOC02095.1 CvpA family protein [bacterium]HQL64428.1 CvpA family protein [bacterium]